MTVPGNLSSPLLATAAAAGAAGGVATRSLRFNDGDSAYLGRTPSSTGNRRTWTLSLWFKRADLAATNSYNAIWSTGTNSDNYCTLYIDNNDRLFLQEYTSSTDFQFLAEPVLRDVSAWYHIVVAFDSTQSTATNRIKIYINGSQVDSTGTRINPSQNYDSMFNLTNGHSLGRNHAYNNFFFSGYMADIYFVDGSQLDPTSFGAYDDNGVWQAAAYSGTFGTNGFHLNFSDASSTAALGTDSSGNSNTFTVNNLVHAGGVAGAGARSAAVSFDGVDDKISFTNNSDLDPGNGNFTLECFVYKLPGKQVVVYYGTGVGHAGFRVISNGKLGVERINTAFDLQTGNTVPENQWVHVAWVKSGTTIKGYINGQSAGSATTSQTYQGTFVTGKTLGDFNNMVISDLHLVKGTALYTTSSFTPPTTISAHANTKLLCFQNASSATTATVKPSGVTLTASSSPTAGAYPMTADADVDVLFDVPTNGDAADDTGAGGEVSANYPTLSPIDNLDSGVALSNGNLHAAVGSGTSSKNPRSTIYLNSGKWYWEMTVSAKSTFLMAGIATSSVGKSGAALNQTGGYGYGSGGNYYAGSGSVSDSGPATFTTGDVIGVKWDADAGTLEFFKNNSSQGTISSIPSDYYSPAFTITSNNDAFDVNFGQRAFKYSAPTNHKPICTATLPTPAIAKGSDHMNTVLFTGNGSSQSITGVGHNPDLIWIKTRSQANDHVLVDSVRGAGKRLFPNSDTTENTQATSVTSFDSDGFSLGSHSSVNQNNVTHVAWCWDAGTSTSSNTDGSITTSVRVNQTCGFSIATYSFNNSLGSQTLGHGLGVIPDLVIRKDRDIGDDWSVYSKAIGFTQRAHLEQSAAWSGTSTFGNASATSTVNRANNMNNGNYVDYSFASIPGFSLASTYTGNGSSDGVFVWCGFRPAFLLAKRTNGTAFWGIVDSARDPDNVMSKQLYANNNNAESSSDVVDFLSNGFKIRSTSNEFNTSSAPYVFLAMAENPFQANGGLAR